MKSRLLTGMADAGCICYYVWIERNVDHAIPVVNDANSCSLCLKKKGDILRECYPLGYTTPKINPRHTSVIFCTQMALTNVNKLGELLLIHNAL